MYVIGVILLVMFVLLLIIGILFVANISRIRTVGSECQASSDCATGVVCDPLVNVCRVDNGNFCYSNSDCVTGSNCSANVCQQLATFSAGPPPETPPSTQQNPTLQVQDIVETHKDYQNPENICNKRTQDSDNNCGILNTSVRQCTSHQKCDVNRCNHSSLVPNVNSCNHGSLVPNYATGSPVPNYESNINSDDNRECQAVGSPDILSNNTITQPRYNSSRTSIMKGEKKILPRGVVDIMVHSTFTIKIMGNLCIRCEDNGNSRMIVSNIQIITVNSFGGHIYGVSNGKLHILPPEQFVNSRWYWKQCEWSPSDIVHTSITNNHMWLQTPVVGYLFDIEMKLIDQVNINGNYRIYGNSIGIYTDYDPLACTAVKHFNGNLEMLNDVCTGMFDCRNNLVTIGKKDINKYSGLKMINSEPVFITR